MNLFEFMPLTNLCVSCPVANENANPPLSPSLFGNESLGLSPNHIQFTLTIERSKNPANFCTYGGMNLFPKNERNVNSTDLPGQFAVAASFLHVQFWEKCFWEKNSDKDCVEKKGTSTGGLESVPSEEWLRQLDMVPGKKGRGSSWERLQDMIALEIAQVGNIVNIFFVMLKGGRRVYEVYKGTDCSVHT